MKKLVLFFMVSIMVFALSGVAVATTFTDTKDLDRWLTGSGSTSWTHATPADLDVPPDTVNSATLTVEAYFIEGSNQLSVNSTFEGLLQNAQWVWTGFLRGHFEGQDFKVASVFGSWTADTPFNVTLSYNEPGCLLSPLFIDTSKLEINYNNGTAAVPEPASMSLVVIGLLGIAGIKRKLA